MDIYETIVELIFSMALLINAFLFIPQTMKICREKTARGVSVVTFLGFWLTQLVVVLHGFIKEDYLLVGGYLLSMVSCGSVIVAIICFKKKHASNLESQAISPSEIINQLPAHVYWKDTNGMMLGCNKSNLEDFGLNSLDDFVNKSDYDLFSAEQAEAVVRTDQEVVRTGAIKSVEEIGDISTGETAIFLSQKAPLRNADGNIIGTLGVSVDVTETKRIELDRLDFLENIIALMPGHVYWINREGVYQGCNDLQAKSAGLDNRKEIVGKRNKDLPWNYKTSLPDVVDKANQEVMESGQSKVIEEDAILSDGSRAIFLSSKVPLKDKRSNVIGMLGISINITSQKLTELQLASAKEKAEVASKAKSEFIANMSHDVRTPITGMLGMEQKIYESVSDLEIKEDAKILIDSTSELLNLLNSILEVTQLESGEMQQKPETFNLNDIINHNIVLLKPIFKEKGVTLEVALLDNSKACFIGHSVLIDRVILNLLSNAIKFTDKGFVSISVKTINEQKDKTDIQMTIEDSGIGIPKDKQAEIFDYFSRLTSSYEGNYKGHGIGLYSVKEYIKQMNGTIEVQSEAGKGAKFIATIPLKVDKTLHSDTQTQNDKGQMRVKEAQPKLSQSIQVLVVEDNMPAAMAAQGMLKKINCSTELANDGKSAVEMAKNNNYDLVLMDIGLPDFSGIEATKQIRAFSDKARANIPIIALTGHGNNPQTRQDALEAGMQEILTKPAQHLKLQSVIEQYVLSDEDRQGEPNTNQSEQANFVCDATIIDWESCVKQYRGDIDFTIKLLNLLFNDLKQTKEVLSQHYTHYNESKLREELHRVRGGISYLTLPELSGALKAFHEAVKEKPSDPEKLKATYQAVEQAIEHFWDVWDKSLYNEK